MKTFHSRGYRLFFIAALGLLTIPIRLMAGEPFLAIELQGLEGYTILDPEAGFAPILQGLGQIQYAEGRKKIALLTGSAADQKITLIDGRDRRVSKTVPVHLGGVDSGSAPSELFVFDGAEENLYFTGKNPDARRLSIFRISLATGDVTDLGSPVSSGPPVPITAGGGIGAFDLHVGGLWRFDGSTGEWLMVRGAAAKYQSPTSEFSHPALGFFQMAGIGGLIEKIAEPNLTPTAPAAKATLYWYIRHPRLIRYQGAPAITTAIDTHTGKPWPLSQIGILDPIEGKADWGSALPFLAADYMFADDGSHVWLVKIDDQGPWSVVRYNFNTRKYDSVVSFAAKLQTVDEVSKSETPGAWFLNCRE